MHTRETPILLARERNCERDRGDPEVEGDLGGGVGALHVRSLTFRHEASLEALSGINTIV